MKQTMLRLSVVAVLMPLLADAAFGEAVGTAFTYQGQLKQAGVPVSATCDFLFVLVDSPTDPTTVLGTEAKPGVEVTNGLFTVDLEFGSEPFAGDARWLDISVCCPEPDDTPDHCASPPVNFTALDPRQGLTPVPYALRASTSAAGNTLDQAYDEGGAGAGRTINADAGSVIIGGTDGLLVTGTAQPVGKFNNMMPSPNASRRVLVLSAETTETAAPGFGGILAWDLETENGSQAGSVGQIDVFWTDPTPPGAADIVFRLRDGSGAAAEKLRITSEGRVGIGTPDPGEMLDVDGNIQVAGTIQSGNSIIIDGVANRIGSTGDLELHVSSGRALRLESTTGSPNLVGGYSGNTVDPGVAGATIGGGGSALVGSKNHIHDDFGTISGGEANRIGDADGDFTNSHYATVSGGLANRTTGTFATIGGGQGNRALKAMCTVGGGNNNEASDSGSTVSGGNGNAASGDFSTVGGGSYNTASGYHSTLGGGIDNEASARGATIGGGGSAPGHTCDGGLNDSGQCGQCVDHPGLRCFDELDCPSGPCEWVGADNYCLPPGVCRRGVSDGNRVTAWYGTIGGGIANTAGGPYAIVAGGYNNTGSGMGSTVPGGESNLAGGDFSLAAGHRAKVRSSAEVGEPDIDGDEGTFVWADSEDADFISTGPNQFLIRADGGVGIGTTLPDEQLHVAGNAKVDGTITSGSSITIDGVADTISSNADLELHVDDGRALRLETNATSPNLIGGNSANSVILGVVGATIGGGGQSGAENRVFDSYNTVGGGKNNQTGNDDTDTTSARYATVGGGIDNEALAEGATIGGGGSEEMYGFHCDAGPGYPLSCGVCFDYGETCTDDSDCGPGGKYACVPNDEYCPAPGVCRTGVRTAGNRVTGSYGTVGGGSNNQAGADDGTTGNRAFATVGGGSENNATGYASTVGGGRINTASMNQATVGGGDRNKAIEIWATVGGGLSNTASGFASMVPGGTFNTAAGTDSLAAGRRARADNDGMFVWADSNGLIGFPSATEANFTPARDQFLARATGGVVFVSSVDGDGNSTTGVQLPANGGAWGALSDRDAKGNVKPVNGRDILNRLVEVPVSTWNYNAQDESIRHVGPMAQDFYKAFGVGENEKFITTIDADGVALAAIQGLYEIVKEKDARIAELTARLERVEAVLARFGNGTEGGAP